MDTRKFITAILLLFIAIGLIVVAIKRFEANRPASVAAKAALSPTPKQKSRSGTGMRVIVYYLHGTSRSEICKKTEALAQEVIQSGFAVELKQGRVEWRVVDYDRPENRHFKSDFDLDGPVLVMVRMRGNLQWGFDRLDEAKDLAGDKTRFCDFLQRQIRETLGE